MTTTQRMYRVIKRQVITEKAADDAGRRNAYHFAVPTDANKVEIRQAIEKLFEVKVVSVNTLRVRGKWRRRGYTTGTTRPWKKAMVTLAEGHTIDTF
ncbi:MAG: 50S ribosomal protein L23 [Planctomycetota bacterium]|jgi:large subunit ribosomal protein L23|nr:50S ribosomal protein L23 [Planctomycetota bacterium]MDP6990098.1 50S ribosomal protein L23 [Planctomycetota bacterium]